MLWCLGFVGDEEERRKVSRMAEDNTPCACAELNIDEGALYSVL